MIWGKQLKYNKYDNVMIGQCYETIRIRIQLKYIKYDNGITLFLGKDNFLKKQD